MIARLGNAFYKVAMRIVPDPFVLALGLSFVVFLLAVAGHTGEGAAGAVLEGWFSGFTGAGGLAFALQMCLILVTGHALALSPPVQRLINVLARIPRNAAVASLLVAFVAAFAGVLHWGLGAIVGAFLAREMARNARRHGMRLHYPLLGAAAYSGLAVWHGGLSGSAPLKVAEEGHFAAEIAGVVPLDDTIFSLFNIGVIGTLLLVIPLLFWILTPKNEADLVDAPIFGEKRESHAATPENRTMLDRLQFSPILGWIVGGAGAVILIAAILDGPLTVDLNTVILLFLFIGLAFTGGIARYAELITDGARGAGGIILQFPFYFGILGMMKAGGLIESISNAMVSISSATTFPLVAFLSAGLVNMFVPSGGGQWAVQADILLGAGKALGVPAWKTVLAFSYGDSWTNTLQPFWALPLLGIMGLGARDIIGYTVMVFFLMGIVVGGALLIF